MNLRTIKVFVSTWALDISWGALAPNTVRRKSAMVKKTTIFMKHKYGFKTEFRIF